MRGYSNRALNGAALQLVNLTLRKPLWTPYSGVDAAPYFLASIGVGLWSELGCAGDRITQLCDLKLPSLGIESYLRASLFWRRETSIRVGYGRGLGAEGINQIYLFAGPLW